MNVLGNICCFQILRGLSPGGSALREFGCAFTSTAVWAGHKIWSNKQPISLGLFSHFQQLERHCEERPENCEVVSKFSPTSLCPVRVSQIFRIIYHYNFRTLLYFPLYACI